ncbi:MAG: 16S rRNA (cytosine(967)-C(5))-methyltransferase RsmB [Bacteroidetes bacterium]|jgi:16S rRNA (cytosine967-C5)-methyltransferase|nr:16S rRNA (cytosine(967)-C(5))-methyltransferase RsmB [Bacteroidota bacterium]
MASPSSRSAVSARRIAHRHLLRVEADDAYVGRLADDDADAREVRQAKDYVAGITRWKRWLDFLLATYYDGDYGDMEPELQQVLRIGAYDLLFLSTPMHATVNEAVELAKREVRPGAGGLTNAVLRAMVRDKDNLPAPETGDFAEDLAILHSHPTWMVRRWLERYGEEETQELLLWNNQRPTYSLRINALRRRQPSWEEKLEQAEATYEPGRYLDDFIRVEQLQPIIRAGVLDGGALAVQDEAAGLVVRVLDPQPGETVVDLCAAPGGKTLYCAARMNNRGFIYAYDSHRGRLQLVDKNARAQGARIIQTEKMDARLLSSTDAKPVADRVLVDAPCTGLGVLSKRADLRWQRSSDDLQDLTTLQDELLDAAATMVRPGGVLVYSTCTIEPEENEERITAFLKRHRGWAREPVGNRVPDELKTEAGDFASLPHRHQIDGAYAARLRRGSR